MPRFKRAAVIPPMQLEERDRQIIALVYQHRFLRSHQLVALLGGSAQQLLRRLQLLYHNNYLERPRAQIDYYHQGGSRHIVYGLGNKGAVVSRQETGAALRQISWSEKNRSVGRMFLEHALLISDVMVALEIGCRRNAQVRLITEEELRLQSKSAPQSFRWKVQVNGNLRLGVIPDRVFALEFNKEDGSQARVLFFLEADRGTMPVLRKDLSQTSFYRKLLAYEATWSQSLHRSQFGFHRFRVLTLTSSAVRVASLVNACSQLKRGHGLFLFADQTILEKPDDLLSSPWQTRKQGETSSLLD